MSKLKITPSTAHSVAPDTPISKCVRIMRDKGFGSILITDPNNGDLMGIFTERDLLRWVDEIQHGGFWEKPISLLMTKPVKTISIDELDKAASIMIERNIRHLPLVYSEPVSGSILAGVISMRDLLKRVALQEKLINQSQKTIQIGLIIENKNTRHLLRQISEARGNSVIHIISAQEALKELKTKIEKLDCLFFDLDQIESKNWSSILKELNAIKNQLRIILLYSPLEHKESELELLDKITTSGRFFGYMKPLNIYSILTGLTEAFG